MGNSKSRMPQKPADVRYLLWSHSQSNNDKTAEELDKVDCVRWESIRSGGVSRAVHRNIVAIGSEIFSRNIHELRTSSRPERPNTMRLDMSVDIMDIILKYLYIGQLSEITPATVIQLYAAAKRYGLSEIEDRVRQFCRENIRMCVQENIFHNLSMSDMESFGDILENLPLDAQNRLTLFRHLHEWCADDTEKLVAVSRLNRKLLLQSSHSTPGITPNLHTQKAILAVVGANIYKDYYKIHILSLNIDPDNGQLSSQRDDPISETQLNVPSYCEDLKCTTSEGMINSKSVIIHNQIYTACGNAVNVYAFKSRQPLYKINCENNGTDVSRIMKIIFDGKLFVYTRNEMYYLNDMQKEMIRIFKTHKNLGLSSVTILNHDERNASIAMQHVEKMREVLIYSTDISKSQEVTTTHIHTIAPGLKLIGSYGELLYFVPSRSENATFYVAFREDVEVKRQRLNVTRARCFKIFNGLLSCFANIRKTTFLLVIDLSSDRILLRRTVEHLGLTNLDDIIPIIESLQASTQ